MTCAIGQTTYRLFSYSAAVNPDKKLTTIEILNSIETFMKSFSPELPDVFGCSQCGSAMQMMDAHFWITGTDKTWDIKLPFCVPCDSKESGVNGRNIIKNTIPRLRRIA